MYCDACRFGGSLTVMGFCQECQEATSSSQKLCERCSAKLKQCESCRLALLVPWDLSKPISTDEELRKVRSEMDRLLGNEIIDWARLEALVELVDNYRS